MYMYHSRRYMKNENIVINQTPDIFNYYIKKSRIGSIVSSGHSEIYLCSHKDSQNSRGSCLSPAVVVYLPVRQ